MVSIYVKLKLWKRICLLLVLLLIIAAAVFNVADRIQTKKILGESHRNMMPGGGIGIVMDTEEAKYDRPPVTEITGDSLPADLRGVEIAADISDLSPEGLLSAKFDTDTVWPDA
jgi:hypothetical protein